MKDQSTPRPWRISQPASITMPRNKNIISGIGDSGGWSALADTCNNGPDHNSEANALLIVKAVNCHDELVEALKLAHIVLLNAQNSNITTKEDDKAIIVIEKALAKAHPDGWIKDHETELEWGPSSTSGMNYAKAKEYCANLKGRLPTVDELQTDGEDSIEQDRRQVG